jgi:copper chaperone CopZ
MRALFLSVALLFSVDAFACPMADAAAYQTARQEVKNTDGEQIAFSLDGMSTGGCSAKVVTVLTSIDGVNAAAVDYQTGEAVVSINAEKVDADAVMAAIVAAGYAASKAELQG